MSYLGISFLVFVLSLGGLIYSVREDLEVLGLISFMVMVFSIIPCAVFSVEENVDEEWKPESVEITRTSRMVIVDDGENLWKFESYSDVTSISDSTEFELLHTTNFWGLKQIEDIRYK